MAIECTKEGVKFSCQGDIGSGSVTLRQHTDIEKEENNVEIDLSEPVSLTFSLKYLSNFTAATGLSSKVKLCLSNEVPLLVEYALSNNSYLRFYLAPKVSCACIKTNDRILMDISDRRRGVNYGYMLAITRFTNNKHDDISKCRTTARVHGLGCRSFQVKRGRLDNMSSEQKWWAFHYLLFHSMVGDTAIRSNSRRGPGIAG